MTREQFKAQANDKFSRLLRSVRSVSRKSPMEVAQALEISEWELRRIEKFPAEIPCFKLYRVIKYYGPEALFEAEFVFQEVDRIGRRFRASQEKSASSNSNIVQLRQDQSEDFEDAAQELMMELAFQRLQTSRDADVDCQCESIPCSESNPSAFEPGT